MQEYLSYLSFTVFFASIVISAISIGKVKAAEAWREIAQARKEEIEVRDHKISELTERLESKTSELASLAVDVEKLKAQPNLTAIIDMQKEFRLADEKRYDTAMSVIGARFDALSEDIDRRFTVFLEASHEYHKAEIEEMQKISSALTRG